MPYNPESTLKAFEALLHTVHRLRAPQGCPWDREQTHQSLRPYLIEEAYETIEVLDQIRSPADLQNPLTRNAFLEEWGDVLLQILLHAEIASESDAQLTAQQIAETLNEKLIRRHPHVFGAVTVSGSQEVVKNWDAIKQAEKKSKESGAAHPAPASIMDTIPKGMPPLPRTLKLIQKVTKVGFQWPDVTGPIQKLQEEVDELKVAIQTASDTTSARDSIEAELGDVLFSVCNIAHFFKIDPEAALRGTLRRFENRFRYVEQGLAKNGKTPETSTLDEMDALWNQAKKQESQP